MLGKLSRENGGVGGGEQAHNPTFSFKPTTSPSLPVYQTLKLSTLRAQRGGLVLHSRVIQFTTQHYNALKTDSE